MEAVVEQNNGHERQIISLSQDSFYRELDEAESAQAAKGTFNFDHPGELCDSRDPEVKYK